MKKSKYDIQFEESAAGLSMRVKVPPRDTDSGERFIYLGSMLFSFIALMLIIKGGDAIYGGLLFLGIGVSGVALSFYNRNRVWRGSDTLYRVSCVDGMVSFYRDDYVQTYERSKLGRIWLTERSTNGLPVGVDLTVYYDGIETNIFDIVEFSRVTAEVNEFLSRIEACLNSSMDAPHEVQTGYRLDYANNIAPQAKDLRELAPVSQRIFYSSLVALPMLVYFSPYSHWLVKLLVVIVVAPILFTLAVSRCRSCTCRYRRPSDFIVSPLLAAIAGWLLNQVIVFLATKEGLPGLSWIIMPAVFLLMSGIIYRIIGGCSCGARWS
ncbi:MAG: hypothetical protein HXX17_07010 [Geobacteraceae bacterium]|nr:hypothetical protein [Geobacteraceae bacterium]